MALSNVFGACLRRCHVSPTPVPLSPVAVPRSQFSGWWAPVPGVPIPGGTIALCFLRERCIAGRRAREPTSSFNRPPTWKPVN
eukprot:356300-Chlamydomonas_euryale.AAC.3